MAKKARQTGYTRERRRVLQAINRAKKQGFKIDIYFPTEKEVRSAGVKGKELAKLTRELKRITPKVVREELAEKEEKHPKRKLVNLDLTFEEQAIIANFLAQIKDIGMITGNTKGRDLLVNWIKKMISDNGEKAVAAMLKKAGASGLSITRAIAYDASYTVRYIGTLTALLPEQGDLYTPDIQSKYEAMAFIDEAIESDLDFLSDYLEYYD